MPLRVISCTIAVMRAKQNTAVRGCIFAGVTSACLIAVAPGCGVRATCPGETAEQVTVVLTFDDGPLAADLLIDGADSTALLRPLASILETLERRGARGVFFIEGPGGDVDGVRVVDDFAEGLRVIHDGGHVLGYHAFRHDPALWSQTLGFPLLGRAQMQSDLDRLVAYLDTALGMIGTNRDDWFTPIFRQPFGGSGLSRTEAQIAAQQRGWIYRGFVIDSVDWTDNIEADPGLAMGLPFETETERIDFVRERIRSGIYRNWDRDVIDILLHVNTFTSDHLDIWIDEIETAYAQRVGATIVFDVPDCYVTTPDATVDRSIVEAVVREW